MYINKNKLPNFFKTQWLRLLIAFAFFVLAIVMLCRPVDMETVEGSKQTVVDMFSALCNIITGMFWVVSALTEHHSECIKALEKRVIQLEDKCITDIDEVGPNHFVAKRRLGPDKETKPQPPKSGSKVEKPKNTVTVTITKDGKTTEATYSAEDFDLNKIVRKALD
ncbi:MAG: hypothetical protein J6A25_07655 [Lachnospiraceae bacterium]|nr:hypothetical protein [Lachnospiraceae bacterium]MBO5425373.1 hypothetical protein [Lachnospiraceae bacterium]